MQRNERQEEERNGEARAEGRNQSRRWDPEHRYWRIDWTCPRCGRESNRGDWYETDELDALEEQIGREIWRCPHCRKRSHPREGQIQFTGHGRRTGADPGPDHER